MFIHAHFSAVGSSSKANLNVLTLVNYNVCLKTKSFQSVKLVLAIGQVCPQFSPGMHTRVDYPFNNTKISCRHVGNSPGRKYRDTGKKKRISASWC